MNNILIENINRIKQLMSLITEDVDSTCVEGDCDNGYGTIEIKYNEDFLEMWEPFDRKIKGIWENKKPPSGNLASYLITFTLGSGDVVIADSELNQELGMTGYGNITFPDGTTYTGTFTQKKLGDEISMNCDKIVKDNKVLEWDTETNKIKEDSRVIDSIYNKHYLLPDIKKSEEEENKKMSDAIQAKIKKQKEDEAIISKQKEDELNKQKEEAKKFASLLPTYVVELQKFIDNKNCDSVYDKINTIISSNKVNTIEKWNIFIEQCRSLITVDQTTNTPKSVSYSKYPNGVVEEIKKQCSSYDWSFIDEYVNSL